MPPAATVYRPEPAASGVTATTMAPAASRRGPVVLQGVAGALGHDVRLVEAAALSSRSVSDLERGIHRTARKDTAVLLAGALNLAESARSLFVAAARGKAPPARVLAARQEQAQAAFAAAATRTLPHDVASFTGRGAELTRAAGRG